MTIIEIRVWLVTNAVLFIGLGLEMIHFFSIVGSHVVIQQEVEQLIIV
jgi:hypothetical protein